MTTATTMMFVTIVRRSGRRVGFAQYYSNSRTRPCRTSRPQQQPCHTRGPRVTQTIILIYYYYYVIKLLLLLLYYCLSIRPGRLLWALFTSPFTPRGGIYYNIMIKICTSIERIQVHTYLYVTC